MTIFVNKSEEKNNEKHSTGSFENKAFPDGPDLIWTIFELIL